MSKEILLDIHPDILEAKDYFYKPLGYLCSNFEKEVESTEYGAYTFSLNNKLIKFRIAKITPKKAGQFVTLWKRVNGAIHPYDIEDPIDFFIIHVCSENHSGQFIFPKSVLCAQGIISCKDKIGKLAIRVYPPWAIVESKQAKKTQLWQLEYFFAFQPINHQKTMHIKNLLG